MRTLSHVPKKGAWLSLVMKWPNRAHERRSEERISGADGGGCKQSSPGGCDLSVVSGNTPAFVPHRPRPRPAVVHLHVVETEWDPSPRKAIHIFPQPPTSRGQAGAVEIAPVEPTHGRRQTSGDRRTTGAARSKRSCRNGSCGLWWSFRKRPEFWGCRACGGPVHAPGGPGAGTPHTRGGRDALERGEVHLPPPFQGAQPMPSHCPPGG